MSDVLNAADAAERRRPDHHDCDRCGSLARPMPILDSRQGKTSNCSAALVAGRCG